MTLLPVYDKTQGNSGGGGGGVANHPQLSGLGYASSGHTGFASSVEINEINEKIEIIENQKGSKMNMAQNYIPIRTEPTTGEPTGSIQATSSNVSNTLAKRSEDGTIQIASGVAAADAVNKGQLDTNVVHAIQYDSNDSILKAVDGTGNVISSIDLPLEELIKDISLDLDTNELILTLEDGVEKRVPMGSLLNGVAMSADLDTHTENLNIHVSSTERISLESIPTLSAKVDEIDGDKVSKSKIVENSSSTSISVALVANTIYNYGTLSNLTITSFPTVHSEIVIYFNSGSSPTVVNVPSTLKVVGGNFTIQANAKYIFSIQNGILVVGEVPS